MSQELVSTVRGSEWVSGGLSFRRAHSSAIADGTDSEVNKLGSVNEDVEAGKPLADAKLVSGLQWHAATAANHGGAISARERIGHFLGALRTVQRLFAVAG
jgi:hypothetical protein